LADAVRGYKPDIRRPTTTSEIFPAAAGTTTPRAARSYVRRVVRGRGMSVERLQDLDLLVSELVTNAVLYAHTDVEVAVHADADAVSVEVRDFGPGTPSPRDPAGGGDGGWGLQLVGTVSERWGVSPAQPGKIVWFRLPTR
jgi:two-component sensor histidine kinase